MQTYQQAHEICEVFITLVTFYIFSLFSFAKCFSSQRSCPSIISRGWLAFDVVTVDFTKKKQKKANLDS